jgi:hypothetical protein
VTSLSGERRRLTSVEASTISLSRSTYQAPQKRHLDCSLNVMYGAMGIRQPDDAVDFEIDEFALGT